jgi:hypothetical protein
MSSDDHGKENNNGNNGNYDDDGGDGNYDDDSGEEGSICLAGLDEEEQDEDDDILASPQLSVRKKKTPTRSLSHRRRGGGGSGSSGASTTGNDNHGHNHTHRHHNNHQHHHVDSFRSPTKPSSSSSRSEQQQPQPQHRRSPNNVTRVKSKAAASGSSPRSPRTGGNKSISLIMGGDVDSSSWGHASMPGISLKELRGGEKKATEVEKIHTVHQRTSRDISPHKRGIKNGAQNHHHNHNLHHRHNHHSSSASVSSSSLVDPAAKIQNIYKNKRVKEGRRSDVKNSLASFLETKGDDDNGYDERPEEAYDDYDEDESLISDEEEAHRRSQKSMNGFDEDDEQPEDSSISRSQSAKRVMRAARSVADDTHGVGGGGSSHSRRSMMINRRSRTTTKDVSDDASVGSRKSRRSIRTSTRNNDDSDLVRSPTISGGGGDEDNRSRRVLRRSRDARSVDRSVRDGRSVERGRAGRSVDASSRRSRRSLSRGADTISRDSQTAIVAGGGSSRRGARSRSRTRADETDGDADNPQSDQAGGASVRRSRSKSRSRDNDDDQSVMSRKSASTASSRRGRRPSKPRHAKASNRLPPAHANCKPTSNETTKVKSPMKNKKPKATPSLSNHLSSDDKARKECEDASETSSRDKSQVLLLQFDPTNADLVQTVNQSVAKKTSEVFRHADGTESEFQISELAGLPTFERTNPDSILHDSIHSGASMNHDAGPPSQRSLSSFDGGSSVDGNKRPSSYSRSTRRPTSTKSFSARDLKASISQIPGEAPSEKGGGGGRRVPVKSKSTTAAPNRQRGLQATKSFFDRMNRSRGNMAVTHQELDDDGSDED